MSFYWYQLVTSFLIFFLWHNVFFGKISNPKIVCRTYLVNLMFDIDWSSVECNYWCHFVPNFLISFHQSCQFNIASNQNTIMFVNILFSNWYFSWIPLNCNFFLYKFVFNLLILFLYSWYVSMDPNQSLRLFVQIMLSSLV